MPLAAFSGTLGNRFVNFDDHDFVTENPRILAGVTPSSLGWAFTHTHHGHWFPLTLLSHMLDVELYGTNPSGHHLTSLLLHAANAALLFLALFELTGELEKSAFAAALFAVHPLQTESIAWVSQRRNILSGLFFMLTLWSYGRRGRIGLGLTVLWMTLGLMSKPTLVALPALLLILDYWPLGRASEGFRVLLREKLPLFAVAGIFSVITLLHSPLQPLERLSADLRLANSSLSVWRYLSAALWPAGLAVYYPFPGLAELTRWGFPAALGLAAVTASTLYFSRRRPYLTAGWLWFLVMLAPVIGLIQVGGQSMADRYVYLPLIGLSIALVWGAAELAGRWRRSSALAGTLALGALMVVSSLQTRHWHDGVTLFRRAAEVTRHNALAHQMLGLALLDRGELLEAEAELRKAVALSPGLAGAEARGQLGFALAVQGRSPEALGQLSESLRLDPEGAHSRHNLRLLLEVLRDPAVVEARKEP